MSVYDTHEFQTDWATCLECGESIYLPDGDCLEDLDKNGNLFGYICGFCTRK